MLFRENMCFLNTEKDTRQMLYFLFPKFWVCGQPLCINQLSHLWHYLANIWATFTNRHATSSGSRSGGRLEVGTVLCNSAATSKDNYINLSIFACFLYDRIDQSVMHNDFKDTNSYFISCMYFNRQLFKEFKTLRASNILGILINLENQRKKVNNFH
jgi:hypothetical protein